MGNTDSTRNNDAKRSCASIKLRNQDCIVGSVQIAMANRLVKRRDHTQQDSGKPLTTAGVSIAQPLSATSTNAPSSLTFMRTFLMWRHCVALLGTTVAPGEMALSDQSGLGVYATQ